MKNNKRMRNLLIGPIIFLLLAFFIPDSVFSYSSRVCLGMVAWMGHWWITLPVGIGVTALIPLAVNALFNFVPMGAIVPQYMNATVLLVFGASVLSITLNESGLDRRIALKFLSMFGTSAVSQITAWLLISAAISSVLPNIAAVALMLPIAGAMLEQSGIKNVSESKLGMMVLTVVAWGASLGGMGTPLGGSMNLVGTDWFEKVTGNEFSYGNWVLHVLPIMIPFIIVFLLIRIAGIPKGLKLEGSKDFYKEEFAKLGKMRRDEWISMSLFLAPTILSFARPLYQAYLPAAANAFMFIIFALISFCINKSDGTPLITWPSMQSKMSWSMIWVLGCGLAVGSCMIESGVTVRLAEMLQVFNFDGGFTTIFAFTLLAILLAEFCNNVTAAAVILPIIVSVCDQIGVSPIPYMYFIIPAYNTAFMMPTSIRAMPLAYGVTPASIIKNGAVQTLASLIVIPVMGYLLLTLFPGWYSIA